MDKKIVEIVQQRANGYCEVCGGIARGNAALHHRKLRSRGGKDEVSNLIYIHHECHNLGTNSIHLNPAMAEDKGWMVPSWKEPQESPMLYADGNFVLLNNDGSIRKLGKPHEH